MSLFLMGSEQMQFSSFMEAHSISGDIKRCHINFTWRLQEMATTMGKDLIKTADGYGNVHEESVRQIERSRGL